MADRATRARSEHVFRRRIDMESRESSFAASAACPQNPHRDSVELKSYEYLSEPGATGWGPFLRSQTLRGFRAKR